ncbi:hypothetical protein K2X85_07130 [bacterium]|nr:hypothetical protein [bacterium]
MRQASSWTIGWALLLGVTLLGCRTERTTYMGWRPFQSPKGGAWASNAKRMFEPERRPSSAVKEEITATGDSLHQELGHNDDVGDESPTEQESPVVSGFHPDPIHPLSPGARIEAGPLPRGYQARLDEYLKIGQQLGESVPTSKRRFQFDTVYNPRRADALHTEAGHILVTSAFLERVETRHQLAGALAMEMAEVLREDEKLTEKQSLATAGVPVAALDRQPTSTPPTEADIHTTASKILAQAGFDRLDLSAVSKDLKGFLLASSNTAAKLPAVDEDNAKDRASSTEPAWPGPQRSMAN